MKTPFFDKRGRLIHGTTVLTNFKAQDPTCADIAVPKAFKEIEARGGQAKAMCKEAGFSLAQIKSAWQFCLAFLLLLTIPVRASDLTPGFVFTDGQRLTAAQLGLLVSQATINPSFYTAKTLNLVLNTTDTILVYDSGSSTYKRITANNFLLNNTNWFTSQLVEKTSPVTNDMFLIYDATGLTLAKTSLSDIQTSPTLLQWWSTNWQNVFYLGQTNATYPTNIILTLTNPPAATDYVWVASSTLNTNVGSTYSNFQTGFQYLMPLTYGTGLTISNGVATNLVGITAREMPLRTATGLAYLARNVSALIDVTSTGTNGFFPAASRTTNGWFYAYIISDSSWTNVVGMLNDNSVFPSSLPTGYTYASRCLGAVYCITNTLAPLFQTGSKAWLNPTNFFAQSIIGHTVYTNFTAAQLTAFQITVPPIASVISGTAGSWGAQTNGLAEPTIAIARDTNGIGESIIAGIYRTNSSGFNITGHYEVPVNWTTGPYWKVGVINSTNSMNVTGYGL